MIYMIQDFKPKLRGYLVSEAYLDNNLLMYVFYVARVAKGRFFVCPAKIYKSNLESWGGPADRFCLMHCMVDIKRAAANVASQIREASK